MGVGLFAVVIRLRLDGDVAANAVEVGGFLAIGMFLVLWNEALVRIRARLDTTDLSEEAKDAAVMRTHILIGAATVGAVLIGLFIAGTPLT